MTDGDYLSPAGFPDERAGAANLIAAEAAEPRFRGEVNGVRLIQWGDDDRKSSCGGEDIADFRTAEHLKFGYLPPGTFATTPQYEAVCRDGTIPSFGQEFIGTNYWFRIHYERGEPVFAHDGSEGQFSASEINGAKAVIMSPITESGIGNSMIILLTDMGAIKYTAYDLALEESIRIVEGISCEGC